MYDGGSKIVVGLDFGVTYSGFAYCHLSTKEEIHTHSQWPGEVGLKTNTVLQYDSDFKRVVAWGSPALSKRPNRRKKSGGNETKLVELFKLYLGNSHENRPQFPVGIDYKKAITDYLKEIGNVSPCKKFSP